MFFVMKIWVSSMIQLKRIERRECHQENEKKKSNSLNFFDCWFFILCHGSMWENGMLHKRCQCGVLHFHFSATIKGNVCPSFSTFQYIVTENASTTKCCCDACLCVDVSVTRESHAHFAFFLHFIKHNFLSIIHVHVGFYAPTEIIDWISYGIYFVSVFLLWHGFRHPTKKILFFLAYFALDIFHFKHCVMH